VGKLTGKSNFLKFDTSFNNDGNKLKTVEAYSYDLQFRRSQAYNIRNMNASAVGKKYSVAEKAYLAGLIDGDGAIMAIIEPHSEKKFRFRVRIEFKITQKDRKSLEFIPKTFGCGSIRTSKRDVSDWITRDQKEIARILLLIKPYSKMKQKQINLAMKIIGTSIKKRSDLLRVARLADALSRFNVRSKNRRKNHVSMIQKYFSPND